MRKRLLAALIGVGAGALLLGAYLAALRFGVTLRPDLVIAGGAAFVFAGAVALFALVAMDRPAFRKVPTAILLNEKWVQEEFVQPFSGEGTLQVSGRPDQPVGEMLARFGDAFKEPPDKMTKSVILTLKGSSKKPFATVTLQQLFAMLKPYRLEHVILTNEKGEFIGYIAGKRALKEFTGDKAMEAIDKYLVKILMGTSDSAVLRDVEGATSEDTIDEGDSALNAQTKVWARERIAGLILHHKLKPVGFISKEQLLKLNAGPLYSR